MHMHMMAHYASGILPMTWLGQQPYFLIGQDVRDGNWSDFGGKVERIDKGDVMNTACREFWEETYGLIIEDKVLRRRLSTNNTIMLRSLTQNRHQYFMFIAEFPYMPHLRSSFRNTVQFLRSGSACRFYVEKTDVKWVNLNELLCSDLPKRSVFQNTLNAHKDTLLAIASSGPQRFRDLCGKDS
jgi:8-oxo-dGTP pyrophosphatase MutT (NUDIX family)